MPREQLLTILVVVIPTLLAEVVIVLARPGPLVVLGPVAGFASFLVWKRLGPRGS